MSPRSRNATSLRRLGLVGLGTLAALVLLEVVLQTWAYVEWRGRRGEGDVASTDAVVLCVGDSFTYGMGARRHDRTYPARLQEHLGGRARVVNGGWVGQTSADVLRRLPGQLALHRPRIVSVLIGVNDYGWPTQRLTVDELADAATEDDGFPLKFRVGRFATAIVQWLGGGPAYARTRQEDPPFVGVWHHREDEVHIRPRGEFLVNWGETARRGRFYGLTLTWRHDGERLLLDVPGEGEFDTQWELRDEALHLRIPGNPGTTVLTRGPAQRKAGVDGSQRAAALVSRYRAGEKAIGAEAVQALLGCGEYTQAFELWAAILRSGETMPPINIIEQVGLDPDRQTALQAAADRALADDSLTDSLRADLLRTLFWSHRDGAPRKALLALLEAETLASNASFTRVYLQRSGATRDEVSSALDTLGVADAKRSAILELHSEDSSRTAGSEDILREHLRDIIRLSRAAGAEPVFLTYPFRAFRHRRLVAQIAEADGVALVAVRARFENLLQTEPWEALFVLDGHCSDRGYDEIARLAAVTIGGSLP